MKKILSGAVILSMIVALAGCQEQYGHNYYKLSFNGNRTTISIRQNGDVLKMEYAGDIILADDETAIEHIAPGGYLKYQLNNKKVRAEKNANGEIVYDLYDGNKRIAFDDNGKKFLAEAIRQMITHGLDEKGRMLRLYQKGGSAALLNEVDNMKGDHLKGDYLEYLIMNDQLTQQELLEVINKIGSEFNADVDKVKLAGELIAAYPQTPELTYACLDMANGLQADIDKVNILTQVARKMTRDEDVKSAYRKVAQTLSAEIDYNKVMNEIK